MRITTKSLLPFFDRAMTEEIGLAIPVNDQRYLRTIMDRAKGEHKPKYDALMLFAPANGEVWLVKKQLEKLDG